MKYTFAARSRTDQFASGLSIFLFISSILDGVSRRVSRFSHQNHQAEFDSNDKGRIGVIAPRS